MKKSIAFLLAALMIVFLCACGKSDAAKHADETIAAIGEVSLSSLSQIERAEKEIAVLSDKELRSLDNLNALYDARDKYNRLAAQKVEAIIAAIGELDFDSGAKIEAARRAYDEESAEVQALVGNTDVLEKAESGLSAVRAGVVEAEIDKLAAIPLDNADDCEAVSAAAAEVNKKLEKLSGDEKGAVKNLDALQTKLAEAAAAAAQYKLEADTELAKASLKDVKIWTKLVYSSLELYIDFTNPSDKTIKYIDFGVLFKNAVGDNLSKKGYSEVYICSDTGPYEPGKGRSGNNWCWTFYNSAVSIYDVDSVSLASVKIEYMDGTKVKIDDPEAFLAVMKK